MASYRGTITVAGKNYALAVEGHPAGRTRITVDGAVVHDKKPFIAADEIPFRLGSSSATLVWKHVGLSRTDCFVRAGGAEVLLSLLDRTGAARAALPEAEKKRRNLRLYGAVAIVVGVLFLLAALPDDDGLHRPKLLVAGPLLLLGGIACVVAPGFLSRR